MESTKNFLFYFAFLLALTGGVLLSSVEEIKWLLFAAAVLLLFPASFVIQRSNHLWLFLIGFCSSFRVLKYLGEPSSKFYVSDQLALAPIDVSLFFLLAPIALTNSRISRENHLTSYERNAILFGLFFCCWGFLSSFDAAVPRLAVVETVNYIRLFLVFLVLYRSIQDRASLHACLLGCLVSLSVQTSLAILQFLFKSSFNLYENYSDTTSLGTVIRSGGTLNPTVLSEYLGIMTPLAFTLIFSQENKKYRFFALLIFCSGVLSMFFTFSRGGLISLLFSVCFVSITVAKRNKSKTGLAFGILLLLSFSLAAASYAFYDMILIRADMARNDIVNEAGRLFQYQYALQIISDNPLSGVGLGNYMEVLYQYAHFIPFPVHNKFLLITGELGIVGLSLYLGFWFNIYKQLRCRLLSSLCFTTETYLTIGMMGAMLGTFINMQTDIYALGGAPELGLFIVCGIGAAISKGNYVK